MKNTEGLFKKRTSPDGLAPNGFPLAPTWAWSARVAVFPGKNIDAGNVKLLDLSEKQVQAAVDRYASRGVNLIQCAGFHARMMWLKHLDRITRLNRMISAAAHRRGIRAFDHHSSNGIWHCIRGKYKGWDPQGAVNVDIRTGLPLPNNQPKLVCINNPDYQRLYAEYILDYIRQTRVDGLMYDDIHFHRGQYGCGCIHCRGKFRLICGYEMPKPGRWPLDDYENPVWRDWIRFRLISSRDQVVKLRRELPADFLFFSCMSAGVHSLDDAHHGGGSFEGFSQGTNCLFSECGCLAYRNQWTWDRNFFSNWERLYVEKKYLRGIASHHCQPSLDLHYSANPDDGWFCWALTKMTGGNYWRSDTNAYGGMKYADEFQEWKPRHDYLNWEARHEELWRYCRPASEVGLVFSFQTKTNIGADPQPHGEEFAGWAQTLQSAKVFFDVLIDADLDDLASLDGKKVLILPNVVCLSERQAAVVREFVRRGGFLVATHQTSLRNGTGMVRKDFLLADLFGVHVSNQAPTQRSSWFVDQRHLQNPLMAGMPFRMPFARQFSICWAGEIKGRTALAWTEKTRVSFDWSISPAIVENRVGHGRVLYLVPSIGALAYREGLFPLWHAAPHLEKEVREIRPHRSSWIVVEPHYTPKKGRWLLVDDGSANYRLLVGNILRSALIRPGFSISGLPEGVLCELYRLAPSPSDRSDRGDRVISLLNVTGACYRHGDWIPKTAAPKYPPLGGTASVRLHGQTCKKAWLYTPDSKIPLPLRISGCDGEQRVAVPLRKMRRLGFIRLGRR